MDDSYPQDGSYYQPTEPEEQVIERQQQDAKAQAAKPMLTDLIAKLDADIAQMSSIDAIHIQPEADPKAFMKAWYGLQQRLDYARELKNHLETLLQTTR